MHDEYRTGTTLFIEKLEGETSNTDWWLDPTLMKVVIYNSDTHFSCVAEREHAAPTIRSWVNPSTFETEHRLLNQWKVKRSYKGITSSDTLDLPVNTTRYSMKDRIRKVA